MPRPATAVIGHLLSRIEHTARWLSDGSLRSRLIVCTLAAIILFVRVPETFLAPQFWAEDGILISNAYNDGWASLLFPIPGAYYNLYGNIVANLAIQFTPIAWPWITTYAALAATLLVVFTVTSPRFELPYKAIAALAVVATPLQDNVLGGLANAQWLLPIALFVLAFCSRHRSTRVLCVEVVAAVVIGLDGPLACFLIPIFAWRAPREDQSERNRLLIITGVLVVCAIIQVATIVQNIGLFDLGMHAPYSHILWTTMPLRWVEALRLAGIFGQSIVGLAIVILGSAALLVFAVKEPHRDLKLAMIFFAATVLYAGMYKMRHFLYLFDNDRYAYAGSIFFFWFLCLLIESASGQRKELICGFAVLLIFTSTIRRIDEHRPTATVEWASAATMIGSGPMVIPIAPSDAWIIRLNN